MHHIQESHKVTSWILEHTVDQPRPLKVIYIGAGISGIIAAIKFRKTIFDLELVIYEKNPEIGGMWYENRQVWWSRQHSKLSCWQSSHGTDMLDVPVVSLHSSSCPCFCSNNLLTNHVLKTFPHTHNSCPTSLGPSGPAFCWSSGDPWVLEAYRGKVRLTEIHSIWAGVLRSSIE